jgi:hypothetical protein
LDRLSVALEEKANAVKVYRQRFGRWPNLLRPKTFNDRLCAAKMLRHDPRLPALADKLRVKDFIAERLSPVWTLPTVWNGSTLPDSIPAEWPEQFVLKANHGSGMNYFHLGPGSDWGEVQRLAADWLSRSYGLWSGEWHYKHIRKQLLVEPFFGTGGAAPVDYKIYVFGGLPRFIQLDGSRFTDHRRTLYDRNWRRLPFRYVFEGIEADVPAPVSLERMVGAAAILGAGFEFMRVDCYEIDGRPMIGELTFVPEAGIGAFYPDAYDTIVGGYWPRRGAPLGTSDG